MHLIIIIAVGVFGGLWMFTRWAEWRADRPYRREMKQLDRQRRQQEREISKVKHQPVSATADRPFAVLVGGTFAFCVACLVLLAIG